jgi:hypothetical protein
MVAPDYVVLDAAITPSRKSKPDALRTVASALDRLTADLASRGAVALSDQTVPPWPCAQASVISKYAP